MCSNKKIIIVGCPRGGTSMVAGYLKKIGLRTVADTRSGKDYPDGYSEPVGILAFNKACEKFRGNRYRLTDDPLYEEGLWECEEMQVFHEEVFKPLTDPKVDFIKVPDLCLAIDYILHHWPDVLILGVWRKPNVTMRSFYEREFGRFPQMKDRLYAIGVWNMFTRRLIDGKKKHGDRVHLVQLEEFSENPSSLEPYLARTLEVPIKTEFAGFKKKPRESVGILWALIPAILEMLTRFFVPSQSRFFATSSNLKKILNP